jgi:hypothetical protein
MTLSKCSPTTLKVHAPQVWAIPVSLATTQGIIIYFLFLPVLRCFSSRGWLTFRCNMSSTCWVVPFGDPGIEYSCAVSPGLSQLTTSFIASQSLGIHHVPLIALKNLEIVLLPDQRRKDQSI